MDNNTNKIQVTHCNRCHAAIIFINIKGAERPLPFNAQKVYVRQKGYYIKINDDCIGEWIEHEIGEMAYQKHHDSCPYGNEYKKRSREKKKAEYIADLSMVDGESSAIVYLSKHGTTLKKLKENWENKYFQERLNHIKVKDTESYNKIISFKDDLKIKLINLNDKEKINEQTKLL